MLSNRNTWEPIKEAGNGAITSLIQALSRGKGFAILTNLLADLGERMKTVIKNINIMTMDQRESIYKKGALAIDGDSLTYVGDMEDMPPELGISASIIDGRRMAALPGFINAHTHIAMTLFRGYADDLPLWEWLSEKIWPLEDRLVRDDIYWLSMLAASEMIAGGVTAFSDMYMFMEETARAVLESGMRAVLARGLQGPDSATERRHREVAALAELNGSGNGRITTMIGPHSVYTCTPDYLRECLGLAQRYNTGIHIHLSETKKEVSDCKAAYGKTPVGLLQDLGLFDVPVLAAHCVHLTDEDLQILSDSDVRAAHCPASNMKLSSGFAPIQRMLDMGICTALGTDGAASNNNLSVMKEMGLTALMMKGISEKPTDLPAKRVLEMGTINGARALGLGSITGSLEPGKKADIVLIDTNKPHFMPMNELSSHMVYSASSGDVHSVWIDGRLIYENGRYHTIDLQRVFQEIERIRERVIG